MTAKTFRRSPVVRGLKQISSSDDALTPVHGRHHKQVLPLHQQGVTAAAAAGPPHRKRVRFAATQTVVRYTHPDPHQEEQADGFFSDSGNDHRARQHQERIVQGHHWQSQGHGVLLSPATWNQPLQEHWNAYAVMADTVVRDPGDQLDSVRGMEEYMSLQLAGRRELQRLKHLCAVLDRQLVLDMEGRASPDYIEYELARVSIKYSRHAQVLARIMGQADRHAVLVEQQEQDGSSSARKILLQLQEQYRELQNQQKRWRLWALLTDRTVSTTECAENNGLEWLFFGNLQQSMLTSVFPVLATKAS